MWTVIFVRADLCRDSLLMEKQELAEIYAVYQEISDYKWENRSDLFSQLCISKKSLAKRVVARKLTGYVTVKATQAIARQMERVPRCGDRP